MKSCPCVSEMFSSFISFDFQSMHTNDPLTGGPAPSTSHTFGPTILSPPSRCNQCAEYSSRISDLESRLTLAKLQAQMAVGKASKACGYLKQISSLDEKVSSLTAKIVHNEECESFILGIIESACEMLRCKFSFDFFFLPVSSLLFL
jgi:hypothetical protein